MWYDTSKQARLAEVRPERTGGRLLRHTARFLSDYVHGENLSLIRSSLVSLMIKGLGLVLVMVVALVLARQMGATEYGRLAYLQSIAFILSILCTLGLRDSANRLVARYVARGQRERLGQFITFGMAVIAAGAVVAVLLLQQILLRIPQMSAKFEFPLLSLIGFAASLGILSFLAPTVVALGRPVSSFALENVGPRVLLLTLAAAYTTSGHKLIAETAIDLNIIANFAPAIALGICVFVTCRIPLRAPKSVSAVARSGKAWLSISVLMMTSPVISLVFSETAILLLGASAQPADVALYQVARRVSEFVTVCGAVVSYLALPRIATHYARGQREQLQRTVDIVNVLSLVPAMCLVVLQVLAGKRLFLLFGHDFTDAYALALVLSLGRFAEQIFGPVLEILLMTGQHAVASRVNIAFAIINVATNWSLIQRYGLVGAAAATVLVALLWKASLYLVLRRSGVVESCLIVETMKFADRFATRIARARPVAKRSR
jgi:O-antigen/teichoic acid export membrane protein